MMLDARQVDAFAAVADSGSFERAAQTLHLTQSAISQRLKQLEERLGQLLVVRGQPLQLTPAGERLLAYQRQQALLQSELLRDLNVAEEQSLPTLAIALNADSLATWFLEALKPVLESHALLLDLRVSDQDRTQQFLRRGEVVGCISASAEPMQGCLCEPLGAMHYRAMASPAFWQRYFAAGVDAQALRQAPAVEFDREDALQRRYLAETFGLGAGDYPRHRVPSPEAYLQLINAGYGWGMVPDQQSRTLLPSGELRQLTPGRSLPVALYWHRLRLRSAHLNALERAIVCHARQALTPL